MTTAHQLFQIRVTVETKTDTQIFNDKNSSHHEHDFEMKNEASNFQ